MKKTLLILFVISIGTSAYAKLPRRLNAPAPYPTILPRQTSAYAKLPWWLNIESGVKGAVGGDLWVAADNSPSLSNMAFTETTGGFAGGVGPFVELRFIKFIALDTEFLFGWDQVIEKDTNNGVKIKFTAKAFSFKIPILLKGVLPLPGVKLSLGTGPILEFPISGTGEVDQTISMKFNVKTRFSVLWAVELGMDVKLSRHFRLPIGFRAAYNLSQPSSYGDRVKFNMAGNRLKSMDMNYQNTWEFRLLMGVAYEL